MNRLEIIVIVKVSSPRILWQFAKVRTQLQYNGSTLRDSPQYLTSSQPFVRRRSPSTLPQTDQQRVRVLGEYRTCSRRSMSCASVTRPFSWPDCAMRIRMPSICCARSLLTIDIRDTTRNLSMNACLDSEN